MDQYNAGSRAPSAAASEWEQVEEFVDGGYYVKVNRAKGSKRFSMEIGGVSQTGTKMRFVPMIWRSRDGGVEMDGLLDAAKLAAIVDKAQKLITKTLEDEGVRRR